MKILALDAGGIKGIYQIAIISELEKEKSYSFRDTFGVYTGTSIGGVIAIFLALGIEISDVVSEFIKPILTSNNIGRIFDEFFNWITIKLENKYFGDISSKVSLPVYDLTERELSHFGINSPFNCDNILISDIIKAICSDYRIMKAYKIHKLSDQFIDAGFFAYDPTMYFIRSLKKLDLKFHILSIGSGYIRNMNNQLNRDNYFDLMYDAIIYDQFLNNYFILNFLEKENFFYYRISEEPNFKDLFTVDNIYNKALDRINKIDYKKLNTFFNS
ncbi:patatin-like phospholipase family protein [Mucilaginibacter arboris]|uniref:PNPLA domain-containing protein n=1 Tax=Mucilaginibacter arboris TaxID=2682090 RepID=A0A7K1T040_9SPHI|nr:patatin-like phospholipase family protein [Mucilaginibacter arboris]MVN22877.1 hypothetical protein [Mucilaginibacter arboris]